MEPPKHGLVCADVLGHTPKDHHPELPFGVPESDFTKLPISRDNDPLMVPCPTYEDCVTAATEPHISDSHRIVSERAKKRRQAGERFSSMRNLGMPRCGCQFLKLGEARGVLHAGEDIALGEIRILLLNRSDREPFPQQIQHDIN